MGRLKSDQRSTVLQVFSLGDAVPEDHMVRKMTLLSICWQFKSKRSQQIMETEQGRGYCKIKALAPKSASSRCPHPRFVTTGARDVAKTRLSSLFCRRRTSPSGYCLLRSAAMALS